MEYGNYYYAFNPSVSIDKDNYQRSMKLIAVIYDVLNEYDISVKCKGYTYMKDAICIITDLRRMDVCFEKEVYSLIADKYDTGGTYAIEHNIRNALNSAYCRSEFFTVKPTNKTFLLMAVQEVSDRLLKEMCV